MYMKLFILVTFSICSVSVLFAQEIQTDSINTKSVNSCVNIYENQTISSVVSVNGCTNLTIQNVNVTETGNLMLSTFGDILINGPFEVQSGGIFNVSIYRQLTCEFIYDAGGNRITRQIVD